MFSSINPGLVALENPLHQQPNAPNPQNPHHLHQTQMVSYAHHDNDHHPQAQPSIKHGYPYSAKNKQPTPLSDEDEPGFAADDSTGDPKRKISPWQRMKWTDTMVRLLIMAVYCIGDEGGPEGTDPTGKKKTTCLLQKKGKWKSVSKAMMEKGFYVSPQQCEDKFNDLNKRYKRVNDILGKGTACKVVENQNLLDTMDLSPKMKEEARKLLNSKHLFFREMCAYHNSCNHGNTSGANQSPEVGIDASLAQPSQQQQQQQQQQLAQNQRCSHSSDNVVGNLGRAGPEGLKMLKGGSGEDDDDDDEEDDSDDYSEEDEYDSAEGGSRGQMGHGHEDYDDNDGRASRKRPRKTAFPVSSQGMQQLSSEVTSVFQDGGRSTWEKKQWMKSRLMQLEEQQIQYQYQAFELEKQRLKWVRFSSKKERDMERSKLENQRGRLENERMVLLIHQKELELQNLQHQKHSSN
ncbi:hypothetical protein L6164_033784 [Bauhinia variegata]|nr:hypothetical protein L6164_033784 [Bauhinia variegata]